MEEILIAATGAGLVLAGFLAGALITYWNLKDK